MKGRSGEGARSALPHPHIPTHPLIPFNWAMPSIGCRACGPLRYLTVTEPELAKGTQPAKITLIPEAKGRTLEIADTGIGMSRDELVENLGTIARSGTGRFVEQLTGDAKTDLSLIGQFGVGFYSTFMAAERVRVVSRKAGEAQAWSWSSDGKSSYTIAEAERDGHGTDV